MACIQCLEPYVHGVYQLLQYTAFLTTLYLYEVIILSQN
jgi:hypothetical protein